MKILRILPIFLVVVGISISCQSNGETTDKIPYASQYEFTFDVPKITPPFINLSIPHWIKSRSIFKTHKTTKILEDNKYISGNYIYSMKNLKIGYVYADGAELMLVMDCNISIEVEDEKYKISWENISVNNLSKDRYGAIIEKHQKTLAKPAYDFLLNFIKEKSSSLKEYVETNVKGFLESEEFKKWEEAVK